MKNALIRGLLIRRKTKQLSFDDEDAIKSAELPALQTITDDLLLITKNATRRNLITVLQSLGIFTVITIGAFVLKAYAYGIAVSTTIPILLVAAFIMHLRGHIDETAVFMEIPVSRVETGMLKNFAVCFLPDGKYRIIFDRNQPDPGAVDVIQFGKFTYCHLVPKTEKPKSSTILTGEPAEENGKDESL